MIRVVLDEKTTASQYIDTYIDCLATLAEKGEPYPDQHAVETFINGIEDDDYQDLRDLFLDERVQGREHELPDIMMRLRNRERLLVAQGQRRADGRRRIRRTQDLRDRSKDSVAPKMGGSKDTVEKLKKENVSHQAQTGKARWRSSQT